MRSLVGLNGLQVDKPKKIHTYYFLIIIISFRPTLESINGNLYLSSAKDKNITLKISGSGYVNINDIDLLHAVSAVSSMIEVNFEITN